MHLTKAKIMEVMKKKGVLDAQEVERSFELVNELLEEEADALVAAEPDSVGIEKELRALAYKVFTLGQEVSEVLEPEK